MPSGLCIQCGPGSLKKTTKLTQIKKVRMFKDAHTGEIIYLCAACAKELGYADRRAS